MGDASERAPDTRPERPILVAEGLYRTFTLGPRRLEVLRGASMAVEEGEFAAIVGLSGVGKSTLLHILGALDRPDAGSLTFRGRQVFSGQDGQEASFRNHAVGFVFQFHHLLPEFTAVENVMIPARVAGSDLRAARTRARALLDRVGLTQRADHRPAQLSGGEQQRVAIARALINDPDIVLADEPSGNLDPTTGRMIYDLLAELRESLGQAVVVTTHSAEWASHADRVLELRDGCLHALAGGESPRAVPGTGAGA